MQADFYLITGERYRQQPLLVVCKLVQKALGTGQPVLILARDQAQAEAIDDLLWAFDELDFIPHQIAGQDDDNEVDVVIATPGTEVAPRPIIINLRETVVTLEGERILEVVAAEPEEREGSRQRWRTYRQQGVATRKFDI